jgi:hypothetical protein
MPESAGPITGMAAGSSAGPSREMTVRRRHAVNSGEPADPVRMVVLVTIPAVAS